MYGRRSRWRRQPGSQPSWIYGTLIAAALCTNVMAAPPAAWHPRGPGGGGALFAPSFSPHALNEMYIGCDMSELFRSVDGAQHWAPVPFQEITGNRASQVRFTSNPSILYALDYTGVGGADMTTPSKSLDGGTTWTRLSADPTGGAAYALYADPHRTDRLLVSDDTTLYVSIDGGATFTPKYSNGNGLYIAGAFFDGGTIYVATSDGLLVSTNAGGSFGLSSVGGIPPGSALVSFAGGKQNGVTRFFAVTAAAADVYPGVLVEDFFSSSLHLLTIDWGQPAWTDRTSNIPASSHLIGTGAALANIAVAYAAGQDDGENPVIYKTTNGGASWSSILLTTNNQNIYTGWDGSGGDRQWTYGAGAIGFAVSPVDPNRAAFTDYGFVHLTTDGGTTWRQGYVDPIRQNPAGSATPLGRSYVSNGLEDTTAWSLAWGSGGNVFAGYTDIKGARSTDGGASWSFNYTGHSLNTMYRVIRVGSLLYAATGSVHDLYQSTYLQDSRIDPTVSSPRSGFVLVSSNDGASWQTVHSFGAVVVWVASDPGNANRLYAAVVNHAGTNGSAGGIWVSSDVNLGGGSHWSLLAAPPRTEGHPHNIVVLGDGMLVATYSGRRDAGGSFTTSSGVFVSTNGGASWIDRSHSGMQYWTKDLTVDPHDGAQNTWYAGVFSGWGGLPNGLGGLYKSVNRGQSWTRILTLNRVEGGTVGPVNGAEMYVTTETDGLWYTANLGAATPTFTSVTSYPFMHPLRVFYNPGNANEIWVTSFGNGLRVGATAIADGDGDGTENLSDCSPFDGTLWAAPSPARNLRLTKTSGVTLVWDAPADTGTSAAIRYDVLRASTAGGFGTSSACAATDVTALTMNESLAGNAYYLIRAKNGCGATLGYDSSGQFRLGRACP